LEPVLGLAIEDKEATMNVELTCNKLDSRIIMLEQTVFKVDMVKGTTIFDEYSEKMTNMNIFLQTEIQKIKDEQDTAVKQLNEQIFH